MAVSGTKMGIKGGKKIGEKIVSSKRESKSKKKDELLAQKGAAKLMSSAKKKKSARNEQSSFSDERIEALELSPEDQTHCRFG